MSGARFFVEDSFEIASCGLFVFVGRVEAGVARPGMLIQVALDAQRTETVPIRSIELVVPSAGGRRLGLTVLADVDMRSWLKGPDLHGQVVELSDGSPPPDV